MKQTPRQSKKNWLPWVLLLTLCAPGFLQAGQPTDEIQGTVEKAMAILKDLGLKAESRKKERREQIR
jgi:hypothetical protein